MVRIISDTEGFEEALLPIIQMCEQMGGYVNPELEFHCDHSHPHGALRLEGVHKEVLSLQLTEEFIAAAQEPWLALQTRVLKRSLDKAHENSHKFDHRYWPLMEMANHGDNGSVKGYNLYGTQFIYSGSAKALEKIYGITDDL